jgi:predicted nucleotidyltransferase
MSNAQTAMQEIEERFVAWATSCPAIRAACVIGSRARVDHPADAWSDLDIVIITSEPERYLTATDWLAHMGVPWLSRLSCAPDRAPPRFPVCGSATTQRMDNALPTL